MAVRPSAAVKAVLGPTNTGKTFLAIERMLGHGSGMIGLPLRLLAREVYDRCVAAKGPGVVALITGEEKIVPENARYFVCTVEAMPLDISVDFLAVDEIQVAADPDRGHVFTDRVLHARGRGETMLLGSDTMRPMLRRLLPHAELTRRERMSTLAYVGARKITKLPKRSAVVAFSADEVYAIAELLRRQRGGAAVVMGALSPRTRNAQVALYQSGEVDFLVATDAIGMGLNMDVDQVAFASRRKFDGHRWRDLRADEIAQIAGRAGRFKSDGAFGETGECPPFDEDIIARVENHDFEAVEAIQWRSAALKFDSIRALLVSLDTPPYRAGLVRVRGADDEEVLKVLVEDAEIMGLARHAPAVERLWDACQLPDFRKASPEEHARLVGRIALHILQGNRRIPSEWIKSEIEKLDRAEGDLDALQARLAHVRTWTYVSNRADWVEDADHWRATTRAVEDKLSDALHAALTQRFIDRRTSALLKGLKREDALLAGISQEGEVTVEGHFVGRLEGLEFKPDPRALGLEGKAVRNAAWRALKPEVTRRLGEIASADESALRLERDGRIRVGAGSVARLAKGASLLKPRVELIGAEDAPETARNAARERLEAWIAGAIVAELRPLAMLEVAWSAEKLPPGARGLAFRLLENAGALDRAQESLAHLDPAARGALMAQGVRIGRHSIYMPALLRPRASRLLAILRQIAHPTPGGVFLPRPGAFSAPLDRPRDWIECAAAGYRPIGRAAIRFDRLEKLANALRAARGESGRDPVLDPGMAKLIGRPARELPAVLSALGYRCVSDASPEGAPQRWRLPGEPNPPRNNRNRKAPEGPFSVLAELMPSAPPVHRRRRRKQRA